MGLPHSDAREVWGGELTRIIADLHVHSRFAMACSGAINTVSMEQAAREKGLGVIGTGDFLHPKWLEEMKSTLVRDGDSGLFVLKGSTGGTRFVLSDEICTIDVVNGFAKRIHHCVLLPSFEAVEALADSLKGYGSLGSDGRPILSIGAAQLVEEVFKVDGRAFVFPAHIWTPYFGVLGARSGFNSIKEAYGDQEKHIHAVETGLSSDPAMNWRVSELDKYALISNSDMHSLGNMGRESNVFDIEGELTYDKIINAITDRDANKLKMTVEFYPEEGRYHYDGHRDCKFSVNPEVGNTTVCRVCGKPLVIGVLHRVNDLADRPLGFMPKGAVPYVHQVPLAEVIAYSMRTTKYSPKVRAAYSRLIERFHDEFSVLAEAKPDEIAEASSEEIADCIDNVRHERISIKPGYAGVYGELDLLGRSRSPAVNPISQKSLFEFSS